MQKSILNKTHTKHPIILETQMFKGVFSNIISVISPKHTEQMIINNQVK